MKNVTVSMEETVADWARIEAARRNHQRVADAGRKDAARRLLPACGFYWDALMIAAAQQQGCTVLLSEDLQHDQHVDGVRVVNPFEAGPQLLDDIT